MAAADSVVLDAWWLQFKDPDLTALITAALAESPDARTAGARLREARATASTGLLAFLPQGRLDGSSRETHTTQVSGTSINIPGFSSTGTSQSDSAAFNVTWEVDLFGRIFAVAKAARGDMDASRFDYQAARASLTANVADQYFQARGLAIQLADARETQRIQSELQRVADLRVRRGLAPPAESDRVAGDLAQSRSQVEALTAELQATRRTLLVLVGRGIAPTADVPVTTDVGFIPTPPATVPGALLARRPDVRSAEARVRSAAGRMNYAELAFFPTFDLKPGLGLSRSAQTGFSSTTRNWSIGASVSQPILSIPSMMADLKASNARTEQAVIAYEKAVQTAYGEADNALVRLSADRQRVIILKDGEARAARAYAASKVRYENGLDDLQTALGAEQSWRAVRSQLTGAQVQALRRTVQTYKALGGGWPAAREPLTREARRP